MACYYNLFSPLRIPFPLNQPNKARIRLISHSHPKQSISCHFEDSKLRNDDEDDGKHRFSDIIHISVTLTVISASLPQTSLAAKGAQKKKSAKKLEAISLQELKAWSDGLPVVQERLGYTEILNLKREGRLKHIIKHPQAALKQRSVVVLIILDDSRALRTVLPSAKADEGFWQSWVDLKLDSLCVNAFSPPFKEAELPKPYLPSLWNVYKQLGSFISKKLQLGSIRKPVVKSGELSSMQKELESIRQEREMMDRTLKEQKRMEAKQKRMQHKKRREESLHQSVESSAEMANIWSSLASNSTVTTGIGLLFFYIFYRTVVLGYRKQKKDYEDRLKIEKAEAEERRDMRRLEREMDEVADEGSDAGGKQNMQEKIAKQFMHSGARVRHVKGRRPPQYLEKDVGVKFKDVAGLGKIRLELEEIVKFFTHKEVYHRRGVRIPGGILLCGPPGVGKTLLAKAVAGEAGVNFFSISASQFVEIYVGVGASRVRTLYQEAKENAPSVVFIDELDAVGRKRGLIKGSGGQERDATLNQLLICLDGFEGRGDVITIASTNRPDILDPALVRPGRFDRKIQIPKPSLIGRIEILQVHARKKPMGEDVDYLAVANMTDGMVGAELANIIEIAALQMIRDRREKITTDDLLQAAQMEERGMLDKIERSPEMWRQIAINEAATAVVAASFPGFKSVEFITISPRAGRDLGYVRFRTDPVKFQEGMISRQFILCQITVHLAPRAADELWHGEDQLSTIWAEAANDARSAARKLVLSGLYERNFGLNNFYTEEKIEEMNLEMRRVLEMCYEQAKEILLKNKELMNAVVEELVQKKSLSKEDFSRLVDLHGSLVPSPPSIIDIRNAKRKQLQELVATGSNGGPEVVL